MSSRYERDLQALLRTLHVRLDDVSAADGAVTLEVSMAEKREIIRMLGERMGYFEPWEWGYSRTPRLDHARQGMLRAFLSADEFAAWQAERDDYRAGRRQITDVYEDGVGTIRREHLRWWALLLARGFTAHPDGDDEQGAEP